MNNLYRNIKNITENIIHITYSRDNETDIRSILTEAISESVEHGENRYRITEDDSIEFYDHRGELVLSEFSRDLIEKPVYEYIPDGSPILNKKQTANGEVASFDNLIEKFVKTSFSAEIEFLISEDDFITGLGQHEDGVFNYRNRKEYLYQNNMKIAIPFLISTKNYGILIDTESSIVFNSQDRSLTFSIDTSDWISYYMISGTDFDEIIYSLRQLTGRASMLPRWSFGYLQSKERYESSEELLNVANKFEEMNIPLDCLIQDWRTWEDDNWGEKVLDKKRFPDFSSTVDSLHTQNTKVMLSIWPNMAPGGTNYNEFIDENTMLPNSNIYNAYDEKARNTYWEQCDKELFSSGLDAFWCDNTEPFSDPDWSGETKRPEEDRYNLVISASKKSMDWKRLNTFALYHIQGLYKNWRENTEKKRVVILTRSLYISGQKYGAIAWSGDISAKWSVLKKQITEGLKMSLSGIPYWTLDIGGFFTVKDKWENRGCNSHLNTNPLWFWDGDYNDGINDSGYRELYTRWLQFGTFLPIFRSHGTDTPREPWHFGNPGEMFYDAIHEFINLRYKLMPYIYSLAADVHFNHSTIMRSLLFDFAYDQKIKSIDDSYMFGNAFLVSPVTKAMYFDIGNIAIDNEPKIKEVYLPKSFGWYDYWENQYYEGGETVLSSATIDRIPLYVKAGSIIPVSEKLNYADEKKGYISEVRVYSGADGEFTIYNDDGNDYSFEEGNFYSINIKYDDKKRELLFDAVNGNMDYQRGFNVKFIQPLISAQYYSLEYSGLDSIVKF